MLFNSIDFAVFLPLVFLLYWFVTKQNVKLQNVFIIIASYIFYGWWDWRFLTLILISTTVDYFVGRALVRYEQKTTRKILLGVSILVNLGFLGFFKYFNFFVENFTDAFAFFGHKIQASGLNIILPVGISFYTFQTLSYTIDVYRKKITATNDFIAFCAFVCFFPQLVAGPIERAANLLPQFKARRVFNYSEAVDGLRQILWGLFKKMVIADNCAELANRVFNNSADLNGSTLLLGAFFFAFQIYGDFSGYSDIAIGTARLFGIKLMQNFAFPYFSRDIAEFWRRWHISLTTWFRDYVYIPLGGSRGSSWSKVRNTFVIFVVSGFWHGANWTFIVWGALNALYFLPLILTNNNRNHIDTVAHGKLLPAAKDVFFMLSTFLLTLIAWIFFRAENMDHAIRYLSGIFSPSLFERPGNIGWQSTLSTLILIVLFLVVEWRGREKQYAIENIGLNMAKPARWVCYMALVFIIFYFQGNQQEFIYFQF